VKHAAGDTARRDYDGSLIFSLNIDNLRKRLARPSFEHDLAEIFIENQCPASRAFRANFLQSTHAALADKVNRVSA